MGFYTGLINSFENLKDAVVSACVNEGWEAADGIISINGLFVRLYHSTTSNATEGAGLIAEIGNGKLGSSLIDPSPCRPRLGRADFGSDEPNFSATYFIHIHTNPDEVYVIMKFNVDAHYFLAFGQSDIPSIGGSGNWAGGTTRRGFQTSSNGFYINETNGAGSGIGGGFGYSSGLFWGNIYVSSLEFCNQSIHQGLDSVSWSADLIAAGPLAPAVARQPNSWNGEALLMPIQVFAPRPEGKRSLVADLKHARYIRVDNYNSGDTITHGPDQWRVYPFYRKNVSTRNGGTRLNHTGTFGWAIRYEES